MAEPILLRKATESPTTSEGRVPPQAVDIESQVLGVIIIAGRPSSGKTSLALSLARCAAAQPQLETPDVGRCSGNPQVA